MTHLSFWETTTFFAPADIVVIGSGIVGLNAAINLRHALPRARIVVLEAGPTPAGASTKNAGFACFGSMTELLDDLEKGATEAEVFGLANRRYQGLLRLRERLGDAAIGYEPLGGYEVFTDRLSFEKCLDHLEGFNTRMKDYLGIENVYQRVPDETLKGFGLGPLCGAIWNRAEGQIHTGQMMSALVAMARQAGVEILNGVSVSHLEETPSNMRIHLKSGIEMQAAQVLVCTNGFTRRLLPELDVRPARNQVLITEPIADLPFRGAFHYQEGYYYFRNVGNRVLLGGGRHLDPKGEETLDEAFTPLIQAAQQQLLENLVLPGRKVAVALRWTGFLGLGERKSPIVRRLSERLAVAVRMGGMGVAIGTLVGEEAAILMQEKQ